MSFFLFRSGLSSCIHRSSTFPIGLEVHAVTELPAVRFGGRTSTDRMAVISSEKFAWNRKSLEGDCAWRLPYVQREQLSRPTEITHQLRSTARAEGLGQKKSSENVCRHHRHLEEVGDSFPNEISRLQKGDSGFPMMRKC